VHELAVAASESESHEVVAPVVAVPAEPVVDDDGKKKWKKRYRDQ
jgi:DNA-binding ferritin-like protein (Dps family)